MAIGNDEKKIDDLLQKYFDGNKEINAEKILSTWSEDLKIISTEKIVGPEGWREFEVYYKKKLNNDLSKWNIEFEVVSKDIFKNCAIVRVDVKYTVVEEYFGETQFLNLLKDKDRRWLIYSKIFTFYPLDKK